MRNIFPKKDGNLEYSKRKRPFMEREGDWMCVNCNNLNFSFRISCNRCHISKQNSEKTNIDSNQSQIINNNNVTFKRNNCNNRYYVKSKYDNFNTKKYKIE
jgi:hypothetical protein